MLPHPIFNEAYIIRKKNLKFILGLAVLLSECYFLYLSLVGKMLGSDITHHKK